MNSPGLRYMYTRSKFIEISNFEIKWTNSSDRTRVEQVGSALINEIHERDIKPELVHGLFKTRDEKEIPG